MCGHICSLMALLNIKRHFRQLTVDRESEGGGCTVLTEETQPLYLVKHLSLTHQQGAAFVNRLDLSNKINIYSEGAFFTSEIISLCCHSCFFLFIFSFIQLYSRYLYLPAAFRAYLLQNSMITNTRLPDK